MEWRGGECKKKKFKKVDVDIIISHRSPKRRASPGFPQEKPQGDDEDGGQGGGVNRVHVSLN